MKSWLWLLFLAIVSFTAERGYGQQSPTIPTVSEDKSEKPLIEMDRNLNADQAAKIALALVQRDTRLLKHFPINVTERYSSVTIEPAFAVDVPLPAEIPSYEFIVHFLSPLTENEDSYIRVAVNRRTGKPLFNGIWYCNEGYTDREKFLKCLDAPLKRHVSPPAIPADRELNSDEMEKMAMSVIYGDQKLLQKFIDPKNRSQHLLIDARGCEMGVPLPQEPESWECFAIWSMNLAEGSGSSEFYVAVQRRTGEVLFVGNMFCEKEFMTRDKYKYCLRNHRRRYK